MPRYFLHVHNSFGDARDDEGQELESLAAARKIAVTSIRSILVEELRVGRFDLRGRIDIEDATGSICGTVRYTDAVDVKTDEKISA